MTAARRSQFFLKQRVSVKLEMISAEKLWALEQKKLVFLSTATKCCPRILYPEKLLKKKKQNKNELKQEI